MPVSQGVFTGRPMTEVMRSCFWLRVLLDARLRGHDVSALQRDLEQTL